MARIEPIPLERMTDEQRALHDQILAQRSRGKVQGPFAVMLHAPDVGARVADMVQHFLGETRMDMKLKELAILCIARRHTAQWPANRRVTPVRKAHILRDVSAEHFSGDEPRNGA